MIKDIDKKGIIGVSGEFFVAAELSQQGIVATMTLKNTPYIDILATNLEKGKTANIQVKTMSIGNNAGWRLGDKDELPSNVKNHFYVFVDLKGRGQLPEYIIIPKKVLANYLYKDHRVKTNTLNTKKRIYSHRTTRCYFNNWTLVLCCSSFVECWKREGEVSLYRC